MTIQELQNLFTSGSYSEETKALLLGAIKDKTDVTPGLIFQVKDIMQKEIDADFKELEIDVSDDSEAKEIQTEYDKALDSIGKDLEKDMKFVEEELKELDDVKKKLSKVSDKVKAQIIKESI